MPLTNLSRGHVLNFILSNNLGDQLTLPLHPTPLTTPSLYSGAAPSSSVNPRELFCCGAVVVCCFSLVVFPVFQLSSLVGCLFFFFQIRPSLSPASSPRDDHARTMLTYSWWIMRRTRMRRHHLLAPSPSSSSSSRGAIVKRVAAFFFRIPNLTIGRWLLTPCGLRLSDSRFTVFPFLNSTIGRRLSTL